MAISWNPTTDTVVTVPARGTALLLASNAMASFRLVVPLTGRVMVLGLDSPPTGGEGIPLAISNPWVETAQSPSSAMFTGELHARNIYPDDILMKVVEGE